jgi:putative tryptophan/tyrosine transport system substrate-binding protein
MVARREGVLAGQLLAYAPSLRAMFRRSAYFIDRILRGARPSDLPFEQPSKYDLVINMATAKALDLTIPPTLLARVDEVIE